MDSIFVHQHLLLPRLQLHAIEGGVWNLNNREMLVGENRKLKQVVCSHTAPTPTEISSIAAQQGGMCYKKKHQHQHQQLALTLYRVE